MHLPIIIKYRVPDWLVKTALVDSPDAVDLVDADFVGAEPDDGSETVVEVMEGSVLPTVPAHCEDP